MSSSLSNQEIHRFSRHLLLPEISTDGQNALLKSSVLIVGAGGLGSSLCEYLTSCGVGRIGVIDPDHVESSNLHRQVIHDESAEGMPKVYSAMARMKRIRSTIQVDVYHCAFSEENGLELTKEYDVIVDASDNVKTRYLVNDACVLSGKPLVSGSAVRFEGQLTVYNYRGGPCYRCLFPRPPPPETVTNCSDGGVLGVVPGIIGNLQALEVIKILISKDDPSHPLASSILTQRMLIFSSKSINMFRTVKIRPRLSKCELCGDQPTITQLIPYDNVSCSNQVPNISKSNRISCTEYKELRDKGTEHVLLDVRNSTQFRICHLNGAENIPLDNLKDDPVYQNLKENLSGRPIYVVCRRGNDSVRATQFLLERGFEQVFNIDGGITSWQKEIDNEFPIY